MREWSLCNAHSLSIETLSAVPPSGGFVYGFCLLKEKRWPQNLNPSLPRPADPSPFGSSVCCLGSVRVPPALCPVRHTDQGVATAETLEEEGVCAQSAVGEEEQ